VITLWWLMSCASLDPCEAAADFPPTLTVSEGRGDFVPITDGAVLTLEPGPQGGEHVWISLRATGLNPGSGGLLAADEPGPLTVVSLMDGDVEVGTSGLDNRPWRGDAESAERLDIQVFLTGFSPSGYGPTDAGPTGPALLVVSVEDSCGTSLLAETDVVLP
jgi:hypothetical protein